jgi:hypothetical protein
MPTNCTPSQATSLAVTYGTTAAPVVTTAAPDVAPTGCSSLPFAPALAATATKDSADSGVDVTTTITQAAGEASAKVVKLTVPSNTIAPNLTGAAGDFGKQVGTAVAVSPLIPVAIPGTVTLTGSITDLTNIRLQVNFPALGVSFSGLINLSANSVTFSNVPDIPLSSLKVDLTGGANSLFMSNCAQPTGTLVGAFTSQNGDKTGTSSPSVTVAGCPTTTPTSGSPTASGGSLSGLSSGKPTLGFTLTAASAKAKIVSFTVALPKGLSFVKKGLKKGVTVKGGKIKKETLKGGKLIVTLKSPVSKLKVKLSPVALKESASLKAKIKKKKIKTLVVKITAKDQLGNSKTTSLKLKV